MTIAIAAMLCPAASKTLVAANPAAAPNVTYTASGIFAKPPVTGSDLFQLQGEPFSISVVANAATVPATHGARWARYTGLKMAGTITSGLAPAAFGIHSAMTSIELAAGNPQYDVFAMFAPVGVVGIQINVLATIHMPPGTIAKALIHPFASIALSRSDTVVYSDTNGVSTTLGIASGTLVATIPGGADTADTTEPPADVQLHAGGAQVITAHADGTKSVRSIGTAPVDLGASSDVVALEFYASGVRDGSEIQVQIAGRDVPVLYAGPAGHFPGLDEVNVKVPRSLAGSGDVDVALTVDGRTASPVHIQIQ